MQFPRSEQYTVNASRLAKAKSPVDEEMQRAQVGRPTSTMKKKAFRRGVTLTCRLRGPAPTASSPAMFLVMRWLNGGTLHIPTYRRFVRLYRPERVPLCHGWARSHS